MNTLRETDQTCLEDWNLTSVDILFSFIWIGMEYSGVKLLD